ncbi:heme-binding protein [Pirellulales bacterium]|nr:heme-binding protein [Pirellulales bacterium]
MQAVKSVCSMLAFQPRKEADLPEGFPTFTPVGVVEAKEYPAYRKAVAGQFWTLFRHIQSNKISMTTPVEMQYGQGPSGELSQRSMAFLYGNTELGERGKNGKVEVVDERPLTVVAIGVRGRPSQSAVNRAHGYLTRWIEAHPEFAASGPPRVMGYNSPMVRQADSFFEVNVRIRKLDVGVSQ